MTAKVAVVGAGLIGRLIAVELAKRALKVTVVELGDKSGATSCAAAGAGMLAPICESVHADPLVLALGWNSADRWQRLVADWKTPVFLQKNGTLVVAHPKDESQMREFVRNAQKRLSHLPNPEQFLCWLQGNQLEELEPELAPGFCCGIYLPSEGQIDNRQVLAALSNELERFAVRSFWGTPVGTLTPGKIDCGEISERFDLVIDCRGMGAKGDILDLRGVRGELIDVHAPEVSLSRPVRVMHPRYPIYVVPRPGHRFLVGATLLESDDPAPLTVQSALELLSAAFSVHRGFAQGNIIESRVNVRPALPDNLPRIVEAPGLLRVNGLYRHGFLFAPAISELVVELILSGAKPPGFDSLFIKEAEKMRI